MYEIIRKEVNLKHDERMPTQCVLFLFPNEFD